MGQHVFDLLRNYLAHYGYGAVAAALLLENAGLPVPGETMLLLASFLAFSEHRLRLPYIILVVTVVIALFSAYAAFALMGLVAVYYVFERTPTSPAPDTPDDSAPDADKSAK